MIQSECRKILTSKMVSKYVFTKLQPFQGRKGNFKPRFIKKKKKLEENIPGIGIAANSRLVFRGATKLFSIVATQFYILTSIV